MWYMAEKLLFGFEHGVSFNCDYVTFIGIYIIHVQDVFEDKKFVALHTIFIIIGYFQWRPVNVQLFI